ncbi:MAG: hypothetical protein CSA26_02255 [Desulfobacterales bacterium]|nr:MAG: hypothetical protein CSA26_02255 [Desulfobacterales bacterium]
MSPQSTTQQVQGITAGVTPTGTHPLLNQLHEANGETPVVIQQWSAKYSPTQAVQTTITEEAGAPQTQGQVIAVYQTEEAEEFIQRAAPIHQNGPQQPRQQFETNGNFIQSHMPNNAVQTASGSQTEQSAGEETGQPNQNAITTLQTDQLKAGEVQAGKEGPQILFTTEPGQAATTTQTAATVSPAGSFIKLPSGFTVPEGAVMDQVINHFSATLKLESGTVSLKLYPKELGELQMEIQVKNDNIKAHITAQNLQAQEALDRHLPRLKATLAEQGFELRQVEITVAASDQYDGQPFQENLERHQLAQSHTSGSDNSYYRSAGEEAEEPQPVELQGLSVTA